MSNTIHNMVTIHNAKNDYARYTTETEERKKLHLYYVRCLALSLCFNITYHSKLTPVYRAQFDLRCIWSALNGFSWRRFCKCITFCAPTMYFRLNLVKTSVHHRIYYLHDSCCRTFESGVDTWKNAFRNKNDCRKMNADIAGMSISPTTSTLSTVLTLNVDILLLNHCVSSCICFLSHLNTKYVDFTNSCHYTCAYVYVITWSSIVNIDMNI